MANPQLSKSRLQALLAMATGTVAEPAAGMAGLYGLLRGGTAQGVRNIDATRAALTYAPSDPRGLQEIQGAVAPVAEKWGQLRSYLGDTAEKHGAGPALSTAAYMVPDTLATLLGARGMGVKGPKLAQMVERSQGPTMGAAQSQIGAIGPISTHQLKVRMRDLKIADENLANGKGSVTPHEPVDVEFNQDTGEYELIDGYHRYLQARGGSLKAALDQARVGHFPEINANVKHVRNAKRGDFYDTEAVE